MVAVPLGHFVYRMGKSPELVLDISSEYLEGAPGFAIGAWPNMGDPVWTERVITYW